VKPIVIFEIANNHMGDLKHLQLIIDRYKLVSKPFRDKINFALKFQFRNLDKFIHKEYKNTNHPQVKRFEETYISYEKWKKILNKNKKDFLIGCTAFDEDSVIKINNLKFDFLKIASCSMNDWSLLETVVQKNKIKNIYCSLAGASEDQIRKNISFFSNRRIAVGYFYCVGMYPTNSANINLSYFSYLRNIYGDKIIGLSTHEEPNEYLSGGMAYAMGAKVFEKHIGLKTKRYSLNNYSTSPKQMSLWLQNLHQSIKIYGSSHERNKNLKEEKINLNIFKRGLFLKKGLTKYKNDIIALNDLYLAFPIINDQLSSDYFSKFKKIIAKSTIEGDGPILNKLVKIKSTRNTIEKIRDEVLKLVEKSKIIVNKKARIEISHHYGINNFKRFGMAMITIVNSKYCKKLLFLINKQTHPAQYHLKKEETFFILYGKVRLVLIKNNVKKVKILKPGDLITIYPKEIHHFQSMSISGAIIEELSTRSIVEDSFYIDKKINKNLKRKSFISFS
jgi:sialic acid synthase SpsE/D-lyxose ketol-isomerase